MRRTNPWQELRITTHQLQHHQWTVSLLMQDHLGWSYQVLQITHPRVVWISLLHLDVVCGKPRTKFHGGIQVSVCSWIPVHLAPQMHGSVCVSASMSYLPVHHFLEEYSVNNTVLVSSCTCQALLSFSIEGNSFNVIPVVDLWMMGEWARGCLTQAQLPHPENQFQNSISIET